MELQQLQYFVTTVQIGSVTKAAEVLYISQPALSRTLRRLEKELGFMLFERGHSGIRLTPGGEVVYQGAEQVLGSIEEMVRHGQQCAGLTEDAISIACAFEEFDNQLIFQFQQRYPVIRTIFNILPPKEARKQLLAGEADFAILPKSDLPDSLNWIPLIREEMLLSTSNRHPLYGRTEIRAAELNGCSILCNDVSFDEETLNRICMQNEIQMNCIFRGNDHHQIGELKYRLGSALFIPISALVTQRELNQAGIQQYGMPETPARIKPDIFYREIGITFHKNRFLRSADLFLITSLKKHYQGIAQQIAAFLKNSPW